MYPNAHLFDGNSPIFIKRNIEELLAIQFEYD
jgi:hypothetical protein